MPLDLYKLQQEKEQPRRKKIKKKMIGFSVQKKALEQTGYLSKVKSKKKKS